MKLNAADKMLRELLERHTDTPFTAACLRELETGNLAHEAVGPIRIEAIRRTVGARRRVSEMQGKTIEGFEALMASLESTDAAAVLTFVIESESWFYQVFTDEAVGELFGIIAIDQAVMKEWRDEHPDRTGPLE